MIYRRITANSVLVFGSVANLLRGTGSFCILSDNDRRNEIPGESALSPSLDIEKSDNTKDHRTDKIDEQILHRIYKSDIQVSTYSERLAVYVHLGDIFYSHRDIFTRGVKINGVYCADYGIFLHIRMENHISARSEERRVGKECRL